VSYLLFTYPNCQKCDELKKYLAETELEGQEYSLILKESKLKIREYLDRIKRDDKGAIIIPTLLLQDEGGVAAVVNNREELEEWLKSRD
jgi:glutaredoxin